MAQFKFQRPGRAPDSPAGFSASYIPAPPSPQKSSPPIVYIRAMVNGYSGYGLHAQQIIGDFLDFGLRVKWFPIGIVQDTGYGSRVDPRIILTCVQDDEAHDWELVLATPSVQVMHDTTFLYTMHESDSLTTAQAACVSKAQHIAVPCDWNVATFKDCSKNPIQVVPLGINLDTFRLKLAPTEGPCVFGTAGKFLGPGARKNMLGVIQAFHKAFPSNPDVRLVVKCYPDCPYPSISDPRVTFIAAHMSVADLADLFASWTALVYLTRGEAWGLIMHQCMAVGRPVIAPLHGGQTMYMTERNAYPVDHTLVGSNDEYYAGRMADVSVDSAAEQMLKVYSNRADARLKGLIAAKDAAMFPFRNMSMRLLHALSSVGYLKL